MLRNIKQVNYKITSFSSSTSLGLFTKKDILSLFMVKITQTKEDLQRHMEEQLDFLQSSADDFDDGKESEAKRMAVQLRILLHDTEKSKSLLGLLGKKSSIFYLDSSFKNGVGQENFSSYSGLVSKSIGPNGGKFTPYLDELIPGQSFRPVKFEEYWNGIIFVDIKGNIFSRKDVILAIANKDGGAHVDSALDEKYVDLTRLNSLGWKSWSDLEYSDLGDASLAAVRQISHEILKTLIPGYTKKIISSPEVEFMIGDFQLLRDSVPDLFGTESPNKRLGRNEKCLCGSGLKWKKCGLINNKLHRL